MKLLGSTERRSCEVCVTDLKLNVTLDDFIAEFRKISQERLANVDFMPGAARLIKHLHDSGVPIAVATSSGEQSVAVKTKHHQEVFKLFHHITKGSDPELKEGKPAPDIFLLAASRFDTPAEPGKVTKCRSLLNLSFAFEFTNRKYFFSAWCLKMPRMEFKERCRRKCKLQWCQPSTSRRN